MALDLEHGSRCVALYVEDHPVNVMVMTAIFRHRPGWRLVVATDGAEGLRLARGLSPTLLLLDLNLPDCHGTALLRALRRLPGCEHVPAIAVTAQAHFVVEDSGFRELWTKPLDIERTLARLDDWVPHRHALLQRLGAPVHAGWEPHV